MQVNRIYMCSCGDPIEMGRVEMGLKKCLKCATRINEPKKMGRMVYYHKTGGEIELMTPETYNENQKYFNRTGNKTVLRQV